LGVGSEYDYRKGWIVKEKLIYSQAKMKSMVKPFIKGPIPLEWLCSAAGAGNDALEAGLMLWYKRGLCKSNTVKLSNREAVALSKRSEHTGRRGLRKLASVGLASIESKPGHKHLVTILATK